MYTVMMVISMMWLVEIVDWITGLFS